MADYCNSLLGYIQTIIIVCMCQDKYEKLFIYHIYLDT